MQVTVEAGEGLEKRLSVELPAERVNEAMDQKLQDLAKHVRLDGFRPGKVPMRVLKQRFGQQVRAEIYGDLIQQTFYEAASQEKLMPAGEPSIELREDATDGGLSYTATFETVPDVEPADLSGRSLKRPQAEVAESDVDEMIDKLRKQRTTWTDVERPAADGDTVTIDFKGMIDGEVFDGGSAESVPLVLGSGSMIDGFEGGLLGAGAGDERTLELAFPADYRAEHLAGKDVVFDVKVNKVAEATLPEIDADFVNAFGVEAGTEEALREDVQKNMEHELRQKLQNMTKERVMDVLLEANPMDLPKAMIDQEAEQLKQQTMEQMRSQGQQSNVDLPASVFAAQAERRVHLGLVVGAIIKAQDLKADEDQVRATIEDMAASYEEPQEVIDYYMNNPQQRTGLENVTLENQVVDWVLAQLDVQDEETSFSTVMNPTN